MRLRYTLIMILGMAAGAVHSQTDGSVEGVIKDREGNPLPNVNIGLVGTDKGGASDAAGKYKIDGLAPGNYILGVTIIGYEDVRKEITVKPGAVHREHFELTPLVYDIPSVIIPGEKGGIFENVPGAATYIDKKEIDLVNPVSGNEVFRRSSGVHVVDEEGLGLRLNLGIRGLDPARSRSVLVMEDGIPVALAPYGEPEMYYTPAMDRMDGVELLKGSGSILYGPQTVGGVVNYITADPPQESSGSVSLRGGEGGFFSGLAQYGNTFGRTGFNVTYLHKQADNIGPTMFRVDDLNAKFKFFINKRSNVNLKIGVYDEESNSTYVGLTQPMWDNEQYYERISPHDRLNIRRYSASASHNYFVSNNTKITTTAFGYTTTRNWQRQDFAYNSFDENGILNPKPSNYSGVTWGDEAVPGGAIYMRNSTGNRNRTFEVAGAESKINSRFNLGGIDNDFTAGARFLYERAFEKRINGTKHDAASGVLRNDEIRTGYGTSAYLHNRFRLTSRLSVTGGARVEVYDYERNILRGQYEVAGESQIRDTSVVNNSGVVQVVPGAGFNFKVSEQSTLFGGVHRGFAPPRIKDAISSEGEAYELEAEKSWNYELGMRSQINRGLRVEITGFYMDFSNQIIPVAEYAGGTGAGLVNGGETRHAGVEGAVNFNFGKWFDWETFNVLYDANVTYVDATFGSDRMSGEESVKGNRTPYAPEWLASSALTFEHKNGAGLRFTGTYVSEQFTDMENSLTPSNNGREGLISEYYIIDATARYKVEKINTMFTLSVKNLLDERYIVSRRPQGIRAGLPRMITAGIKYNF